MTVLMVLAHPCPESFVAAVFERAVVAVTATDSIVECLDLYSTGYVPGQPLAPVDEAAVGRASTLVLVYPTWWSSQPATLGAWLAAVAELDLSHIGQLVCVTTHGSGRIGNFLIGRAGRLTVAKTFRARCASNATFRWIACYGVDTRDAAHRAGFLSRIDDEFGAKGAISRR